MKHLAQETAVILLVSGASSKMETASALQIPVAVGGEGTWIKASLLTNSEDFLTSLNRDSAKACASPYGHAADDFFGVADDGQQPRL